MVFKQTGIAPHYIYEAVEGRLFSDYRVETDKINILHDISSPWETLSLLISFSLVIIQCLIRHILQWQFVFLFFRLNTAAL